MRIFSVLSGQTASRMIQHEGGIGARIFSPDGQMFATGSLDQTVRLWDAQTGMQVGATLRLQRQVGDVCFSKDGRSLFVQAGGQTYRASLPPPVSASRDNVRLAVEVATGLKIDEGGTVLTQMDDEWHLRKEKLSAHATPVFGGPEANESDGDPSSGRTPEELDARRKAYLDKYLKALAEFRKHDVPPETHSKQFPPHVELHADMSTDGMNVKLYSDWECRREVDREYLEAREARKRRDNAASVKIRYPPMPTHYKAYFDKKGHRRQVEAHGTDGRMTSHVGYAAVRYWYDEQDNCVQETHLDVEGNVTENLRSIATAYHVYDNGERKETRFYNEEGKPDEDFLGVHRRLYRAADTLEYRLDDTQRIRWLEPINLGKRINGKAAWYPCVGSDGKELYYAMGWTGTRKTEPFGIHRIRWEENRWSDPQPVLAGGNPLVGTSPAISSDDQFLAFIAWKSHPADGRSRLRKATNLDESDVYISEWSDAGWQAVRNAGQEVNERTQGTVTFYPGTHDLLVTGWQTDSQWKQHKYLARHSYRAGDGKWMARAPVEIEKTPGFGNHIRGPSFPREESAMCFSFSSGGAGYGSGDLWYTTLEEGRWTRPVNLGTPVNTGSEEGMPALFPNGDILYFDAIRSHSDAVGTHSSTWNILATGRADSETAIRHLADIYADSDLPAPP